MISHRNATVMAAAFGSWLVDGDPVDKVRDGYERMAPPIPADVTEESDELGGVSCLRFTPDDVDEPGRYVLYFHGGGFTIGSARSHAEMTARIARACRAVLYSVDYRLSPEHVFPAALDDAEASYRALLERGISPTRIAVGGDSAGGGIALSLMVRLRDEGMPMPACAAMLSAWADLSCSGSSYQLRADVDPLVTPEMGLANAAGYLAGHDARDPLASPVFADLTGFPPLLLQTGSDEMLFDDTTRVADSARRAGVPVDVQVADGMMHVYQLLTWLIPEALPAIDEVGAFIRRHIP